MQRAVSQLLAFEVGRDRFGIALDDVDEIARAVTIARLPKAPDIIEGVIDVRGRIIPVLDIRKRFRLPPKTIAPSDQLVIARAEQRIVAIRVDRVVGLVTVADDDVADIDSITPAGAYLVGVAKLPDGLILIHNLATFLSAAEAYALDAFEEPLIS